MFIQGIDVMLPHMAHISHLLHKICIAMNLNDFLVYIYIGDYAEMKCVVHKYLRFVFELILNLTKTKLKNNSTSIYVLVFVYTAYRFLSI